MFFPLLQASARQDATLALTKDLRLCAESSPVGPVLSSVPQASARQDATLALMKDLPPLLRKLQTDPAQASCCCCLTGG